MCVYTQTFSKQWQIIPSAKKKNNKKIEIIKRTHEERSCLQHIKYINIYLCI